MQYVIFSVCYTLCINFDKLKFRHSILLWIWWMCITAWLDHTTSIYILVSRCKPYKLFAVDLRLMFPHEPDIVGSDILTWLCLCQETQCQIPCYCTVCPNAVHMHIYNHSPWILYMYVFSVILCIIYIILGKKSPSYFILAYSKYIICVLTV